MAELLIAVALLLAAGVAALLLGRWPRAAGRLGAGGAVLAGALGFWGAARVLLTAAHEAMRLPWAVPYGTLSVEADPLSAWFLLPLFLLGGTAAVYGLGYLPATRNGRSTAAAWFFYDLLLASMVVVLLARNGMLFLAAWEVMSLAAFFLVAWEHEREDVRQAGWTFLVAAHLGAAFLMAMFAILGNAAGSLDFDRFAAMGGWGPATAGLAFLLAVVGFGVKAGLVPFHVWLPEAHPVAPSHVSALLSGVMIKMGVYGLVRTLSFLGPPPLWWGALLVGLGLTTGIYGVLQALMQREIKRVLAYSSVENVGIITLGLGLGCLGVAVGSEPLAVLGTAGALLHVANHALFKGLLFLDAGAVLHGAHTGNLERLGGLLKRMPGSGAAFLVGAAAIAALPPLNGLTGEFLIYLAALSHGPAPRAATAVASVMTVGGLALIGGLAAACFARVFGVAFLGEPRSEAAAAARESGPLLRWPVLFLAGACVVAGLLGPWQAMLLRPALSGLWALPEEVIRTQLAGATPALGWIAAAGGSFLAVVAMLAGLRRLLLRGRPVERRITWDCGYLRPSPRMQYTASSFARSFQQVFAGLAWTRRRMAALRGPFPKPVELATEPLDAVHEALVRPSFLAAERGLSRLRWLQSGRVQVYVLYVAITLVVLLVWKLGWP